MIGESFFLYDSLHLIKSARYCLLSVQNRIYFLKKCISWNDVTHFYQVDSSNKLRCAPKLREHINPNNFQRMRVSLGTQVLSNTVSTGMRILHQSGKIYSSNSLTFLNTAEYLNFLMIYLIFLILVLVVHFLTLALLMNN